MDYKFEAYDDPQADAIALTGTIFDSVPEAWILADSNATVLLVSKGVKKLEHLLQHPLQRGSSVFESIPHSWREYGLNMYDALLHSSTPFATLEAQCVGADGKEVYFEIRCTKIHDKHGQVINFFVEARDLTPQKIFEKKITIVAREYQNMIENANAVIIGIDARGYITEWNDMACQATGYSKNEAYAQRLSGLLTPEAQASFSDAIQDVLSGDVLTNHEMTVRAKDERRLTLLINATPRTSTSNEVVGVLLIGQDISELSAYRKSLEQKVSERTKALKSALESERKLVEIKDRFVSMASHEFRSPISYIHRNIVAVKDNIKRLSAVEIVERLSKIQSHAEHLSSLLEDVLTMGRTGAKSATIQVNLKPVDLREFLLRVIDEVQTNMQHSHQIHLDFSVSSLLIPSDENLLRNIFVNLLTNAIKFSPGKKDIFLSVKSDDGRLECKVKDQGVGIEEKDIFKIFDPFHRGGNVENIKGTGLGLSIVKKAVETLGGEVAVESTPGLGTAFIVHLNLHNP